MSETILHDIIQDQNTVIYDLKSSVGKLTKMDDLKLRMLDLIDEYFHENNQQDLVKKLEEKDIEIQKQKDIIHELNEKYDKMEELLLDQTIDEMNKVMKVMKVIKHLPLTNKIDKALKNLPLSDKISTKEEKPDEEEMVETYHLKMTKMEREFRKQAEEKANKFKTFQ